MLQARFEPAIPASKRPQTPCLRPLPHWDRPSCVTDKQKFNLKTQEKVYFLVSIWRHISALQIPGAAASGWQKATSVGECGGGVGPYSRTLGRGEGAHKAQPRPLRLFWFLLLIEMPRIPRIQRERDRTRLQRMVTTTATAHACLLWSVHNVKENAWKPS